MSYAEATHRAPPQVWQTLASHAQRHPRVSVLLLTVVLMVGDFVTGVDLAFTLFYLAPVALAIWWRGSKFAYVVIVLCTATSVLVELWSLHQSHLPIHPLTMLWNHGGSFLVYLAFAKLTQRVRVAHERDAQERRTAVEQLRQADRLGVVGKLAAGVAHELGTPLNVIVGYAELMIAEGTARPSNEKASQVILRQTDKMTKIIRGLLDFSRPASGDKIPVELGALAQNAKAALSPIARKKNVQIEIDTPADTKAVVLGNAVELEQVLLNLMVNGIQAMADGGVLRVHVKPRIRDPNVRSSAPPCACLEVQDEGVGIPPESIPKIFDPFFTTKGVGQGTGLGLSVSYGIVSDHGGHIRVTSTEGKGSRFSVFLPLEAA